MMRRLARFQCRETALSEADRASAALGDPVMASANGVLMLLMIDAA
jgi:hypothetical protein